MNTTIRKTPLWLAAGVLGVILLTTLACSVFGMSVGKNGAVIDVTLNQDQVNHMLENSTVTHQGQEPELLEKVTSVEMMDGFMRVYGTATDANGAEVEGSYDVSVSAKDDILMVEIIDVNVPGVDMSDPRIVKTNQQLVDDLTKSVTELNGEVLFKEASVKDGVLKIKIQVNFKDN